MSRNIKSNFVSKTLKRNIFIPGKGRIGVVDHIKIFVHGGTGGRGSNAFHKLDSVKQIPTGGNGGRGGDVYIQCKKSITTLLVTKIYRFKRFENKNDSY